MRHKPSTILLVCLFLCEHSTALQVCHKGSILYTPRSGPDVCIWCIDGVGFMPEEWHSNRHCYNCTHIENLDLEILVSTCNRTHDAVVLCKKGYYRRKARNVREKDVCVKCHECDSPTRLCQEYDDTICCLPNYDVEMNKDGIYVCQERPIRCKPGQYFNVKFEQCLACPEGTYMSEDNHAHITCKNCEIPSQESHEVVELICNRTHPTKFRCKSGYFRTDKGECSQCMRHMHKGRACDGRNDTNCCMVVDDTENSTCCASQTTVKVNYSSTELSLATTASPVKVCMPGQYLSVDTENGSAICKPCSTETLKLEKINNFLTICNDCKDVNMKHLAQMCIDLEGKDKNTKQNAGFNFVEGSIGMVVGFLLGGLISNIIWYWWRNNTMSRYQSTLQVA